MQGQIQTIKQVTSLKKTQGQTQTVKTIENTCNGMLKKLESQKVQGQTKPSKKLKCPQVQLQTQKVKEC